MNARKTADLARLEEEEEEKQKKVEAARNKKLAVGALIRLSAMLRR